MFTFIQVTDKFQLVVFIFTIDIDPISIEVWKILDHISLWQKEQLKPYSNIYGNEREFEAGYIPFQHIQFHPTHTTPFFL